MPRRMPSRTAGPPQLSKKRKSTALAEIAVDLSLPEPPSKKARRALKKGKPLAAPKASPGPDDEPEDTAPADNTTTTTKNKKDRSPYGVWIGNLPFTVSSTALRQWLVDNSGGAISADAITRVHMPRGEQPSKKPGRDGKTDAQAPAQVHSKGFAYVDFSTYAASIAAMALSETDLGGRKLLIKDSKSFAGRPEKKPDGEATEADGKGADRQGANGTATAATTGGGKDAKHPIATSRKIFVGNLGFTTNEDDLWAQFEKCGPIEWVKVATFEDTGKCKGFGWVKFKEPEAAAWAVKGFVKIREEAAPTEDDSMDDAGDDVPDKEGAEQAQVKKGKMRKWWVNKLKGRTLKIELAEDDQVRYKRRFGKDAEQQKLRKGGRAAGDEKPATLEKSQRSEDSPAGTRKAERGGRASSRHHEDIVVARLTGAAVPPQGQKKTFD